MTRSKDDIDRRVRAYLAKAESAIKIGNTEEAQTYFSAVSEMVHKYDLDTAVLMDSAAKGSRAINIVSHVFHVSNKGEHGRERISALFDFVYAMECKAVTRGNTRNTAGCSIEFEAMGPDDVIERLRLLIPALLLQMDAAARQSAKSFRERYRNYYYSGSDLNGKVRAWYRSVVVGYGMGVADKIGERIQVMHETSAGTGAELVLLDRATALDVAYTERWPKLGTTREITLNGDAVHEGRKLGRQADLGDRSIDSETQSIDA